MTAPVFEASLNLEAIVAQMLHKKEPHIDSKDDAFPKLPMGAGSVTACRPVLHGHLQVFRGHDAGSPGFDQCLATSLLTTRHKQGFAFDLPQPAVQSTTSRRILSFSKKDVLLLTKRPTQIHRI